ncbi:MAG: ribosome biogenesis GTPase Der [Alphaproteobacteria bacterium]|nr:ribosome biogenesis GTPase Der [Alphaproteobacteria bacterium]
MLSIAIIGRPNVGKSTLFNRLAGKRLAIVDDRPGVTRDWREAEGYLLDQPVRILDTAGLEETFDESIEGKMRQQTELAMSKADVLLFLVDGRAGITPMDEHFAQWLRKQKKPVVVAVNKCENEKATQSAVAEAHKFGFGTPLPISSAHGEGIEGLYFAFEPYFPKIVEPEDTAEASGGSLSSEQDQSRFDDIEGDMDFEFAPESDPENEDEKSIKIAIAGRPNAGKSTLLNALLNDTRVMTSPVAGTTRDAIAVDWEYAGKKIRLVDTAGLRKKARISDGVEKMAVEDTLRAIRLAQVVILVIDATMPLEKQDLQIADHILDEGRAMVIAVNKWDLIPNKKEWLDEIHYKLGISLAQVRGVPVVPISALKGSNLTRLMDDVLKLFATWNIRVNTGKLNRWIRMMESRVAPPLFEGRSNRLKYMAQINVRPPTFILWVSKPQSLPDTYKRYLMNGLRDAFDMEGVPIRLLIRTSKNPYQD